MASHTGLNAARLQSLAATYRDGLLNDTVPFWLRHGFDRDYGGIMTCLNRDGAVIDTDKGLWQQGRFTWLLSTLLHDVEDRPEWRAAAAATVEFMERAGYDPDDHMYFLATREGKPLRKRRYVFTESFAAIALAAWARVSGDEGARDRAIEHYQRFVDFNETPGWIKPKMEPGTRPCQGMGPHMIRINTAQVLRDTIGYESANADIDFAIDAIDRNFVNREWKAVLETATPDGDLIDHFDGRLLNPGHAIEAAWFILHEAWIRDNDPRLVDLGCTMLDWMWERGWDSEYGGIRYFCDVKGLPVQEYWHDMKFWWPQNEAIIATLLAWALTGDDKYARMHTQIHDWAYAHFPDHEFGEWFGYLHRDGRLSVPLKGNIWKGPFHIPRMQWFCWRLCERLLEHQQGGSLTPLRY